MNITLPRAVIEQALEALEQWNTPLYKRGHIITALRTALGQQYMTNAAGELEPVTVVQTGVGVWKLEPVAFKDAPERIYLQACEDDHCEVSFREHDEITWCAEQQNPLDVPYVRADLAAPPQRKPEQEPVAWMLKSGHGTEFNDCIAEELKALTWKGKPMWTPLYDAPPQRKPLSLDELWRVFTSSGLSQFHQRDGVVEYKYEKCIEEFARAIEAAHGIKGEV